MAKYSITRNANRNWDEQHVYSYRRMSTRGERLAQEEFDRRRATGETAFLWKWEKGQPHLMEHCN